MKKIIFSILYAFIFISTSCQKSVQEDGMTVYPADYARMAKFERVKTNELPDDSFSPQLLRNFEKGKNAQAQGKYRAAIENYTKCLDENEEFANAYVNRGNCYAKLGKFDNALDDFYQALLVERNFFTYYSRGLVYEAKGENLLALINYNKSIDLGGNFCPSLIRRAFVHTRMEKYDSAIADLNKAFPLDSLNPDLFRIRADVYTQTGKYELAIEDFNRAMILDPRNASDYYNRGNVCLKLEDYQDAVKDYTKAITLNSRYAKAYHNRAIAYSYMNCNEKAIQDYLKAATVDKSFAEIPGMWYRLGEIFFHKKKDYRKAIFYYTKAIGGGTNEQDYFSSRADAYYNLKAWEKALRDYNAAYELAKKWGGYLPDILTYRGDTYMQLHDYSKALNNYLEAENIHPFESKITFRISACYRIMNNFEKAEMYLNRARLLSGTTSQFQ